MDQYSGNHFFTPLALTEENVDKIFNYCQWDSTIPYSSEKCCISLPFQLYLGYSHAVSKYVRFDKSKLLEMKQEILYLLGQVKDIEGKYSIDIGSLTMRYDSVCWFNGPDNAPNPITFGSFYPMNFAYLITADILHILSDFGENHFARILTNIEATLSPDDVNFPQWYDEYMKRHPEINFKK